MAPTAHPSHPSYRTPLLRHPAVDETGLIAHLEPAESPASRRLLQHAASNPDDGVEMLDYSDKHTAFLLPGFIDTHLHAPQYLYTGTALDEPLMVWLEK